MFLESTSPEIQQRSAARMGTGVVFRIFDMGLVYSHLNLHGEVPAKRSTVGVWDEEVQGLFAGTPSSTAFA